MSFITKQGQGFRNEPHQTVAVKRVLCFDGKQFRVSYARHVDRSNDHLVVEVGNGQRLSDFRACLSPSDAYQLATALMNAAEALEDREAPGFPESTPKPVCTCRLGSLFCSLHPGGHR